MSNAVNQKLVAGTQEGRREIARMEEEEGRREIVMVKASGKSIYEEKTDAKHYAGLMTLDQ